MRNTILFCLVALAAVSLALGDACTDKCDQTFTTGDVMTFCSSSGVTFSARQSAVGPINIFNSSCYAVCGFVVLNVGTCGCPNGCFNDTGNGRCLATDQCQCNPGWGGRDCSAVKCPSTCSGHGSCKTQTAAKGGDICECQDGWTANDCAVQIPQYFRANPFASLPYGEVNTATPYFLGDKYNDTHQFFNYSVIPTIKITSSASNLAYLLNPGNIYESEYQPATLYFYNGLISKTSDITFRTKGYSSRLAVKKSWNVKFPKSDSFRGLKGFSLKSNTGDRLVSSQVILDLYRAEKVQTYRHAMAQLFINDVFYGVVSLEEKIDDGFMKSRWGIEDEKLGTNLYKLTPYVFEYLGNTTEPYQNLVKAVFDLYPANLISQEEGDGNWNDLLSLVLALNGTSTAFTPYLNQHYDLATYFRAVTLECALRNADAYLGTGNNHQMVDIAGGEDIMWQFVAFDFDLAMVSLEDVFARLFRMTTAQLKALIAAGVTSIAGYDLTAYILNPNPYVAVAHKDKPLANAIFAMPGSNASFTAALKEFTNRIILSKPGESEVRRQAFYELARPIVARDKMYTASAGANLAGFDTANLATKAWIVERWGQMVSMFYADNHGTCDQFGNCVCFEGYYGAACESYCGVGFTQSKSNAWTDGNGQEWSQYTVTLNAGASPLYSVKIEVTPNATNFNAWNIDQVPSNPTLYTIPSWQYSNGAIPANSNSVSFGYTVSNSKPAKFRLYNNACALPSCSLAVTQTVTNSWVEGSETKKQVQLNVENQSSMQANSVNIKLSFTGGAYVASSWNIAPSTSNPGEASKTFSCSLYNLAPGQTATACGYILSVPTANLASLNSGAQTVSGVCV